MILYDLTTMTDEQVDQVASNLARWEGVAVAASARSRFECHRAMARVQELHGDVKQEAATFHSPRCQIKYWRSVLFAAHGNLYRIAVESFDSGLPPG